MHQNTIWTTLNWLIKSSKSIRLRLLTSAFTGVARVICSLLFVAVSKWMIDGVTSAHSSHTDSMSENFIKGAILIILLLLGEIVLRVISSWLMNQTEIRLKNSMRLDLFKNQLSVKWIGRKQIHTGDIMNRLEEDVRVITNTLCQTFPQIFVTLFQLCAALWFMQRMDSRLAILVLFILPFFLCISKLFIYKLRKLTAEIRSTDSVIQSIVQESIQHNILLRTMEYASYAINKLGQYQSLLYKQTMHRSKFTIFSRTVVSIGFVSGYITVFLWGLSRLGSGEITFGVMTAFLQLVGMIQRPTADLTQLIPSLVHATTSIDRIINLYSQPKEEAYKNTELSGCVGIEMKEVTFHYEDGTRNILNKFSHTFQPGSHTAILGETGAGKSTITRLMLALLTPQQGSISIFNEEKKITISPATRCNFIYIPQGNTLMSGTILDNLLLGNPDATEAEIKEALYIAVAEFVYSLPKGLDTPCDEIGGGLSEGQAQRIAIARGLLRNGNIILLDEPTSSLDNQTEKTLMERLSSKIKDKTMIVVTHKENVAQECNESIIIKTSYSIK